MNLVQSQEKYKKFSFVKVLLPIVSCWVNGMKNRDAGNVIFSRLSQKIFKIFKFSIKARDVVHNNKLVQQCIFSHKIIMAAISFFSSLKKIKANVKFVQIFLIFKVHMTVETILYIVFSIFGKIYSCQPLNFSNVTKNFIFSQVLNKGGFSTPCLSNH